jgi:hypothetical protein
MAKDPAFLFYSSDFLSGTFTMSNEQVGKYIRLLCLQHQKGSLNEKDMLNICQTYDEDIYNKFVKKDNLYINVRLSDESEKRKKFSESRKNNRKGIKSTTYDNHMNNICETHVQHMENENENENEDIIVLNKNGKKFISSDFSNLPDQYFEVIKRQIKTIKQMSINDFQIKDLWECFKVEKLTGDKWFNTESEVYSYFTNWIKNQKFSENDNRTNQEKQIDFMHEYIYGSSGRKDS